MSKSGLYLVFCSVADSSVALFRRPDELGAAAGEDTRKVPACPERSLDLEVEPGKTRPAVSAPSIRLAMRLKTRGVLGARRRRVYNNGSVTAAVLVSQQRQHQADTIRLRIR